MKGKTNNQGMTIALRVLLLREYFYANASRTKAVRLDEIQQFLENNHFPAERRTIYSDIASLRSVLNLDIDYSMKHRGYLLMNPPYEPYELRLMVDGIQSSKFITKEEVARITDKIKRLTDTDTRHTLNRQIYVANRVRSKNEAAIKSSDRIHQAIAEDKKIRFRYFYYTPDKNNSKSYSKKGDGYIVSPYALLWNNGNYYLYAYVNEREKFKTFRVDRMESISTPLPEPREGREEFNERDILDQRVKVFEMYHGKEYNVKIRFINQLASAVIDQFGKDIVMIPADDNHFTITAPIEISPPFFAWIATFGRRAKILGPEPVVEEMKKFIGRVQDMYKDEGEM